MKAVCTFPVFLAVALLLSACAPVTRPHPSAPAAGVYETIVTFESEGQTVVGTLALPRVGAEPFPTVLMLHGFTNTRDELPVAGTSEKMYERMARVLGDEGIASLRIDFRGSGDSAGAWADTTFTGQISDTLTALNYLATLPMVDMTRLGLLGFSQGGLVAAEVAAMDQRVRNVVLWSAVANAPDTYKHILSDETVAAGLASGGAPVAVTTQWGAQFELKTGFFADLFRYDPTAAIVAVEDPLLVVVGLDDTTVTPQPVYGELLLRYHDGVEHLFAVESDHVYNVLTDPGPQVFDAVVAETVDWLVETLATTEP
jgi:cephalosporin-C deacetylase-like acetyl esterase